MTAGRSMWRTERSASPVTTPKTAAIPSWRPGRPWRPAARAFFQAEDGIRHLAVTGVQTCALPICRVLRQWPACNVVLQSPAFEQLHHDELLLVMLTDLVHHADIRMIERRGSTRFAQEAFERALIFRQILGQELQGHGSPQNKVFGTVDDSHATASKLFENAVVGHSRAKHRARSRSYRSKS